MAGFKSFVDATTVVLPSSLCAIVGPNGCGKSNIIDAVRWVMGESSAKQLRGESITDVIFNGSGSRKQSARPLLNWFLIIPMGVSAGNMLAGARSPLSGKLQEIVSQAIT